MFVTNELGQVKFGFVEASLMIIANKIHLTDSK